jgi:iron(II)-dependent oxidoreductase
MFVGGLLALGAGCLSAQPSPPANRKALIIANSRYQRITTLATPPGDAAAMRASLQKLGFTVQEAADTSLSALVAAIEKDFLPRIHKDDIALIYFSGYGIQAGNDSYLLPVDFDPQTTGLSSAAYSIGRIMFLLDGRQAGIRLLITESAWEEPALLAKGFLGLTPPTELPSGSLLALANSPGTTGAVAAGPTGMFTHALAEALVRPGVSLGDLFGEVQTRVRRESNQRQQPYWIATGLPTYYFIPPKLEVEVKEVVKEVPVIKLVESNNPFRPNQPLMNKNDRQEYLLIPAGKFKMGCVPVSQASCEREEFPQHDVEISKPFWMGRTEVEVKAYQRFAAATKRKMPPAPLDNPKWQKLSQPIVRVSWEDAQEYCKWAGEGGRLPTEAEWEYAARAGKENQVLPMDDLTPAREKANFDGRAGNDTFEFTAPVKSFDPNAFGLYDIAGNVWEWTLDFFDAGYYAQSPARDPRGPATGKEHVIRGGSFQSDPVKHLRISVRSPAEDGSNKIGFRCVLPDGDSVRAALMQ